MITKFKIFESVNKSRPEIGDYVIVHTGVDNETMDKFYNNNIGQIVGNYENGDFFDVQFDVENNRIPHGAIKLSQLKYWSKDKEELELIITSLKFNI